MNWRKLYKNGVEILGASDATAAVLATAKQPKVEGSGAGIVGFGIAAIVGIIAWPHIKKWT